MTKLVIFNAQERQHFDSPPKFTEEEKMIHLSLINKLMKIINQIRTPTNQIGFILQYSYFKATSESLSR
jgi:hypothetical protein